MKLQERIELLATLGKRLEGEDEYLRAVMHRTHFNNPWFTIENQERAVKSIAEAFLQKEKLENWLAGYDLPEAAPIKTVGLVMAGNLPLVGFHDLLCVFAAGQKAKIKLSDKDKFLLPYLLKLMGDINPAATNYFEFVEKLAGFDAVIATGSNNSARYFESYFGKYPHIIRKNRNSVAVLDGSESEDDLLALGKDVFRYFGMGCRNVSKLYVPQGYDFQLLMERLHEYRDIILHDKYKNNFDYQLAILILNRAPHLNNGCVILVEQEAIPSGVALLHYSFYKDKKEVEKELRERSEEIQCVVAKPGWLACPVVPFGKTQSPGLEDYADGVDVMAFLKEI
jgi:hypothetical protein